MKLLLDRFNRDQNKICVYKFLKIFNIFTNIVSSLMES